MLRSEPVVQAAAHDIGLETDIVRRGATGTAAIEFAEIDVEIFQLHAPIRQHRIFGAAADRRLRSAAGHGEIRRLRVPEHVRGAAVISGEKPGGLVRTEALFDKLDIDPKDRKRADEMRIGGILAQLGCERVRRRWPGEVHKVRCWRVPKPE